MECMLYVPIPQIGLPSGGLLFGAGKQRAQSRLLCGLEYKRSGQLVGDISLAIIHSYPMKRQGYKIVYKKEKPFE